MTLRITLKDGELVIVNGAVLRSFGRSQLIVENDVALMRGRDIMTEAEADSPAKRLYFSCMMAYLDKDNHENHRDKIIPHVQELFEALESPKAKTLCADFAIKVAAGQFYKALNDCRALITYEAEVMGRLTHFEAPANLETADAE